MAKYKTVEMLTKAGKGKRRNYLPAAADVLIKHGLAKEVAEIEIEDKPKVKKTKKSK